MRLVQFLILNIDLIQFNLMCYMCDIKNYVAIKLVIVCVRLLIYAYI